MVLFNQHSYCLISVTIFGRYVVVCCVLLLQVEFAPPVGYKEPERVKKPDEEMVVDPAELMPEPTGFVAFRGEGNRCVVAF